MLLAFLTDCRCNQNEQCSMCWRFAIAIVAFASIAIGLVAGSRPSNHAEVQACDLCLSE